MRTHRFTIDSSTFSFEPRQKCADLNKNCFVQLSKKKMMVKSNPKVFFWFHMFLLISVSTRFVPRDGDLCVHIFKASLLLLRGARAPWTS